MKIQDRRRLWDLVKNVIIIRAIQCKIKTLISLVLEVLYTVYVSLFSVTWLPSFFLCFTADRSEEASSSTASSSMWGFSLKRSKMCDSRDGGAPVVLMQATIKLNGNVHLIYRCLGGQWLWPAGDL